MRSSTAGVFFDIELCTAFGEHDVPASDHNRQLRVRNVFWRFVFVWGGQLIADSVESAGVEFRLNSLVYNG
jgi:hypothetical protein